MDQNTPNNATRPLTFVDIIRMFKVKTVIIIVCLALVAAIAGGIVGFLFFENSITYGAEITFYLTSKDGTHALLPLLNSDSFAEKLLLNAYGLPEDKASCDEEDYDAAVKAVEAYNEALKIKHEYAKIAETLPAQVAEKKSIYESDLAEYTRIYDLLNAYLNAYKSATEEASGEVAGSSESMTKLLAMIDKYEAELDTAANTVKESKAAYDEISKAKLKNDVDYAEAKKEVKRTRTESEDALEAVLVEWRKDEDLQKKISIIRDSISFEYAKLNESGESAETVENENAAFLIITVNVPEDEKMANLIVDSIILRAPDYVEKNIERLTGATDPKCTLISTFASTEETADHGMWVNIAIFGGVFGAGVLAVSCFAVVVYHLLPDDMKRKKKASK